MAAGIGGDHVVPPVAIPIDALRGEPAKARRSLSEHAACGTEDIAYLDALDKVRIDMAQRYLRPQIKQHKLFVLSTQTADELDILFLSDYVMGSDAAIEAADVVIMNDDLRRVAEQVEGGQVERVISQVLVPWTNVRHVVVVEERT